MLRTVVLLAALTGRQVEPKIAQRRRVMTDRAIGVIALDPQPLHLLGHLLVLFPLVRERHLNLVLKEGPSPV